jgi:hypothetical protein
MFLRKLLCPPKRIEEARIFLSPLGVLRIEEAKVIGKPPQIYLHGFIPPEGVNLRI